jgi:hypothetical protein
MNRNNNKYEQAARTAVPNKPGGYVPMSQTQSPRRSWLASEGGLTVNNDVAWKGLFAGKPAPTGTAFELAGCVPLGLAIHY